MRKTVLRIFVFGALLTGCATPASRVKVTTLSVQEAWNQRANQDYGIAAREVKPAHPAGSVFPVVSAPDIRMAYMRPWKDDAGNYHYGGWIALYVDPPKWVLPDGSLDPIERVSPRRASR
jgi:Type IV conjugative transfer system lipoprotein (TraV)